MPFDLKKLDNFPSKPGVYLMKDAEGTVLYVGKANNLKQRVKQYFASRGDGRVMVPYLIAHVESIDTIIVTSEKEALLLENTLIKQHTPKYNALLKDDKTFIALKLNNKHPWPMLQLVRYRGKPKPDGLYFGPYTGAYGARQTLDLLQKLFPLRQCTDQELVSRTRPCILYDMKRCVAPCVRKCTEEEYQKLVKSTIQFLRGSDEEVLKDLYEEMNRAAEHLNYEKAAQLLKTIRAIEKTIEQQHVDNPLGNNIDVLGIFREGHEVVLSRVQYREGKLTEVKHYNFSNIAEDDEELLESFLMQQYQMHPEIPEEILVPKEIKDAAIISELLSQNRRKKISIHYPQRGVKKNMIVVAHVNAQEAFRQGKDRKVIKEKTLIEMQEIFHLQHFPEIIECIDNSNLGGAEPVSSLVAFKLGEMEKSRYRKFKIKTAGSYDDYAAMREVLLRRYSKAKEENNLPDLLIIDGGKGHLNVALQVFSELNIVTVDLISLAKEEGRHDRGLTSERVFLASQEEPISFKPHSPVLFLLQQIRDEAHRFAITFQRKRRSKQSLGSALDTISGIGPVKRKLLLKHFGSVQRLKEATLEEIQQVKGISKANAQTLYQFFHC